MAPQLPETVRILLPDGEVKEVTLEYYVRGVVAATLEADAPLEALKAQAVAARTFAGIMRRHLEQGADVCTRRHCQAWQETTSPLSRRAIEETKGIVATFNGELIEAFYFEHCDGHTRDAAGILANAPPYLRSVACPCGCAAPKGHSIGMCQRGARVMARFGETYERILKHYYSGILLERAELVAALPLEQAESLSLPIPPPARENAEDESAVELAPPIPEQDSQPELISPTTVEEPEPAQGEALTAEMVIEDDVVVAEDSASAPPLGIPELDEITIAPAEAAPTDLNSDAPVPLDAEPVASDSEEPSPTYNLAPGESAVEHRAELPEIEPEPVQAETLQTLSDSSVDADWFLPDYVDALEYRHQPSIFTFIYIGPEEELDTRAEEIAPAEDEGLSLPSEVDGLLEDEQAQGDEEIAEPLHPPDSMPEPIPVLEASESEPVPDEIPEPWTLPPLPEVEPEVVPARDSTLQKVLIDYLPGPRVIAGNLTRPYVIVTIRDAQGHSIVTVSGMAKHYGAGGFEAPVMSDGEYSITFDHESVDVKLKDETVFIHYTE